MCNKLLISLFSLLLTFEQVLLASVIISAPLNSPVIQSHEELLLSKGSNRDWGGKFELKENRKFKNYLTLNRISKDRARGLNYHLTVELKKFNQTVKSRPALEEDDSYSLTEEVKELLDTPLHLEFNGEINSNQSEAYLLLDTGLELFIRNIFMPFDKKLDVGTTFEQEFFLRPDDAVRDEEGSLPLVIQDSMDWADFDDDSDLDDLEPKLLIKYTITKITDSEVFAKITGLSSSMDPSLIINGKGVWQRSNPLINEISYDFQYSEKRKNSWIDIEGSRKTSGECMTE